MRRLVFVRHGQSVWNSENRFTGWTDVALTAQGIAEAEAAGDRLLAAGLRFETVYTSALTRTRRSAEIICDRLGSDASIVSADALNERDYGELTGLNKDEARARFGADQVRRWRRSYAEAPPAGESLRDLQARLLGFYVRTLLPATLATSAVLMVGHGNTLRALTMALDDLSADEVERLEYATGEAVCYQLASNSAVERRWLLPA
jgi:2,3-bisphosphoglycerate-dependent phosphoglycerate mutase